MSHSLRELFSEGNKIDVVLANVSAGTSTQTTAAIDMAGYEGVLIVARFGTAAANNTVKVQQSSDDAASDAYADLTGTSVSVGSSDEIVWVEVKRPKERYLKAVFARGTSTTLGDVYAIRYGARSKPVTNALAGTIAGEAHVSPAEGTA